MNLIKLIIVCTVLCLFAITPVSAVANAGFETGDLTNWFSTGSNEVGTTYAYSGTYGAKVSAPGAPSTYIGQAVGLGNWLSFERRIIDTSDADFIVFYQGISPSGNTELYREVGTSGWNRIFIDTSNMSGYYGNIMFRGTSYTGEGFEVWIDDVSTTEYPPSTLSGYVEDSEGDPMLAYLSLNSSIDPVESDVITGYYEFTDVPSETYLLTVTKPTQQDYTAVIVFSGDTEHNVSMTRLLPDLIYGPFVIDTEQTSLMLGWTENSVVDFARIYQGVSTNLIYIKDTSYAAVNSHTVEGLDCGSPYTFWVQPMDGVIAGPKYEVSDITDLCDVSAVVPIIDPTPTPVPTEIPDDENGEDDEEGIIEIIDKIIDDITDDVIEFFDESLIEPAKVVIEEVIVHVTTTFNWVLLGFVYLSTLASLIINKREDVAGVIVDTALYGTLATMTILILSFVGFSVIFSNELIAIVIFVVVGFIFGILPETLKDKDV